MRSANSFAFPACSKCNARYSDLETKSQPIVMGVVKKGSLKCADVTTLLDWFDKVRVGIWLGSTYLNKESLPVTPSFYINDRVRIKDRALYIYRLPTSYTQLSITGPTMPLFAIMPSCFALLIHNTVFINFSYDHLFSKNAGFPYTTQLERCHTGKIFGDWLPGEEEIRWPLNDQIPGTLGLSICQVCLPNAISVATPWHRARTIDRNTMISLPLVQCNKIILSEFERNPDKEWLIPTIDGEPNYSWNATALLTIILQEHLFKWHSHFTQKSLSQNEIALLNIQKNIHNELFEKLTDTKA